MRVQWHAEVCQLAALKADKNTIAKQNSKVALTIARHDAKAPEAVMACAAAA